MRVPFNAPHNAEANYLAQQCRVLRLENAKWLRLLRKHGVRE